jgi:molybdopterin-guanine dinucleotide biosynthesis protein A
MIQHNCTGILLAGGESKRFNGAQKSNLLVGQSRIIDRLMAVLKALFTDIIIVSNQPQTFIEWDALIVTDIYKKRSSLTGIHTGLFYAQTEHAFIAACDAPYLNLDLVTTLCEYIDQRTDVIIPKTKLGYEPLCAIYSRRILQPVQNALDRNKLKISGLFGKLTVKEIPESVLRKIDPDLISFYNINTPKDLELANSKFANHGN